MNKPKDNVSEFVEKCAGIIGAREKELFMISCDWYDITYKIESPIERMLLYAIETIINANELKGIKLIPQYPIGKFRADFLITKGRKRIIIECDSQQFHERTEGERRYEKERERFIVRSGYKIFRYTGKEITDDAFEPVAEIISFLTGINPDSLKYEVSVYA